MAQQDDGNNGDYAGDDEGKNTADKGNVRGSERLLTSTAALMFADDIISLPEFIRAVMTIQRKYGVHQNV